MVWYRTIPYQYLHVGRMKNPTVCPSSVAKRSSTLCTSTVFFFVQSNRRLSVEEQAGRPASSSMRSSCFNWLHARRRRAHTSNHKHSIDIDIILDKRKKKRLKILSQTSVPFASPFAKISSCRTNKEPDGWISSLFSLDR